MDEEYYPREHPLEREPYDERLMEEANRRVLTLLGYPWDKARLDISTHPLHHENILQ